MESMIPRPKKWQEHETIRMLRQRIPQYLESEGLVERASWIGVHEVGGGNLLVKCVLHPDAEFVIDAHLVKWLAERWEKEPGARLRRFQEDNFLVRWMVGIKRRARAEIWERIRPRPFSEAMAEEAEIRDEKHEWEDVGRKSVVIASETSRKAPESPANEKSDTTLQGGSEKP